MVRTINITFDEKDFKKIENAKNQLSIIEKRVVSWENFVWLAVFGKNK